MSRVRELIALAFAVALSDDGGPGALQPRPQQGFVEELTHPLNDLLWRIPLAAAGVAIAGVAFLALRAWLQRIDTLLAERRDTLKPIVLLDTPVVSAETVGGALSLLVVLGRAFGYSACTISGLAVALFSFELTRPLVYAVGAWALEPIVRGVDAVLAAIPGLVLAALLVLGLRSTLRVLNLFLDGVESRRVRWRLLPPRSVPSVRALTVLMLVAVLAPLVVAAAFGGFGSPLETLAIWSGLVLLVATLPIAATLSAGVVLRWRGTPRAGEWVQVGAIKGEVSAADLHGIQLVSEDGGVFNVNALTLLLNPVHRLRAPPHNEIEILIARDRPLSTLMAELHAIARACDGDANVRAVGLYDDWVQVRVSAPVTEPHLPSQLLLDLSDSAERQQIRLADRFARRFERETLNARGAYRAQLWHRSGGRPQ